MPFRSQASVSNPAVTIQYNAENERKPPYCSYSAVPQMQGRGLRSVLPAHKQADDTADGVLLDSYTLRSRVGMTALLVSEKCSHTGSMLCFFASLRLNLRGKKTL